jgi:hypothetical protein
VFAPGLRIRIHFIRIRIQHFKMNTNPDPQTLLNPDLIRIRNPGFHLPAHAGGGGREIIKKLFYSLIDDRGLVVGFYVASKDMVSYSSNMGKCHFD